MRPEKFRERENEDYVHIAGCEHFRGCWYFLLGGSGSAVIQTPGGLGLTTQVHDVNMTFETVELHVLRCVTCPFERHSEQRHGHRGFRGDLDHFRRDHQPRRGLRADLGRVYAQNQRAHIAHRQRQRGAINHTFFQLHQPMAFRLQRKCLATADTEFLADGGDFGGTQIGMIVYAPLNNVAGGPAIRN